MTYSGTNKNIHVVNDDGTNKRLSTHVSYNEAHMSSHEQHLPPMAITLQQQGYVLQPDDTNESPPILKINLRSNNATMPLKATEQSAGYDIFSSEHIILPPFTQTLIHTDICIEIPTNYFGLLKLRSGLACKHNIHVNAGVIDSDYSSELQILLSNESPDDFIIDIGMRIAQLIIFNSPNITTKETDQLLMTKRDNGGFGSTGLRNILPDKTIEGISKENQTTAAAAILQYESQVTMADPSIQYNVLCSDDPFLNYEDITLPTRGKHLTQGFITEKCPNFPDRVLITAIQPGAAARRIKYWIRRLKYCHILQINGSNVTSPEQANKMLNDITKNHKNYTIRV